MCLSDGKALIARVEILILIVGCLKIGIIAKSASILALVIDREIAKTVAGFLAS